MSNISGALREDMDDCILPLDPAPKEMKSNNNIFINIFLVIGPGSEIAYDKKYEHCTFVFCAIEREQMSKIINRLDAISCQFICHENGIIEAEDFQSLPDNKGFFQKIDWFRNVNSVGTKKQFKNVAKMRIHKLIEGE